MEDTRNSEKYDWLSVDNDPMKTHIDSNSCCPIACKYYQREAKWACCVNQ